jgi:beta-aspartyl-peptidase (threonine type)
VPGLKLESHGTFNTPEERLSNKKNQYIKLVLINNIGGAAMRRFSAIIVLISLIAVIPSFGQTEHTRAELLQVLDLQKAAWNKQDIEEFMAYYWNSDQFTFQSGASRLYGWKTLLERYKKSYSGENWGKLDFTDLEVNALSADSAYVLGRWKLDLQGTTKEGVFTIIFKRFPEGWRIIHDHSS